MFQKSKAESGREGEKKRIFKFYVVILHYQSSQFSFSQKGGKFYGHSLLPMNIFSLLGNSGEKNLQQ